MSVGVGVGRAKAQPTVRVVDAGLRVFQRGAPKLRAGTWRIRTRKQPARRHRSLQEQTVRHRSEMERR